MSRALGRPCAAEEPDSPGSRWRLFVGTPLPTPAAERLWSQLADVRGRHPQARWLAPESYHATLVFLGSRDPGAVAQYGPALETATRGVAAFPARLARAGGRPGGRRGGVAWLRLSLGRHELSSLSLRVDEALGSGLYAEGKPRPHVTVARRVERELIDDLSAGTAGRDVEWQVERVVLYRSHTGPGGARYEELAAVRLER